MINFSNREFRDDTSFFTDKLPMGGLCGFMFILSEAP